MLSIRFCHAKVALAQGYVWNEAYEDELLETSNRNDHEPDILVGA